MRTKPPEPPLWKKLAWFAALWAGGVLVAILASWLIKASFPG